MLDYENPWIYNGTPFDGVFIGDHHGFVYNITNLTNGRQYIGRKYFWSFRKPRGKKRKVKSELIGESIMGLARNLRKTLNDWVDKILVELSCHYIKHLARQTTKKQDNSSLTTSSQSPWTAENQRSIIATSSADT